MKKGIKSDDGRIYFMKYDDLNVSFEVCGGDNGTVNQAGQEFYINWIKINGEFTHTTSSKFSEIEDVIVDKISAIGTDHFTDDLMGFDFTPQDLIVEEDISDRFPSGRRKVKRITSDGSEHISVIVDGGFMKYSPELEWTVREYLIGQGLNYPDIDSVESGGQCENEDEYRMVKFGW